MVLSPNPSTTGSRSENRDWSLSNLDRFLLKGLEDKGLNPVGDTDKATLLRRVYFDLIGLPPNPEQVQKFLNSTDPKAFEAVVDQLLADYAFAERWGGIGWTFPGMGIRSPSVVLSIPRRGDTGTMSSTRSMEMCPLIGSFANKSPVICCRLKTMPHDPKPHRHYLSGPWQLKP